MLFGGVAAVAVPARVALAWFAPRHICSCLCAGRRCTMHQYSAMRRAVAKRLQLAKDVAQRRKGCRHTIWANQFASERSVFTFLQREDGVEIKDGVFSTFCHQRLEKFSRFIRSFDAQIMGTTQNTASCVSHDVVAYHLPRNHLGLGQERLARHRLSSSPGSCGCRLAARLPGPLQKTQPAHPRCPARHQHT